MRCEDCRYFDTSTQQAISPPDTTGLCRVNPPIADERDGTARWPFVGDTDWCGKYKVREVPAETARLATDEVSRCIARGDCTAPDKCRRDGDCTIPF